jgi:hypothetical protein
VNGAWILIGFYDWEVRSDGSKKCDLLEIYSNLEKDKLKQTEAHHLAELIKIDGGSGGGNCTFSNFHLEEEEEEAPSSSEEEDDTEDRLTQPSKIIPPSTNIAIIKNEPAARKETTEEQLDWLNINISAKDI